MIFSRKKSEPEREDILIVLSGDEAVIEPIIHMNEEHVQAGALVYPRAELSKYLAESGRVFVANVPEPMRVSAEKIGQLADSQVLKNVFQYNKPERFWSINTFMLLGMMILLAISILRR